MKIDAKWQIFYMFYLSDAKCVRLENPESPQKIKVKFLLEKVLPIVSETLQTRD